MRNSLLGDLRSIRFAAFDLDGTLLGRSGELFPGVMQGIEALVKANVTPIIVTGRTVDSFMSLRLADDFLDLFDDEVICAGGNVVVNRKTGVISVHATLPDGLFSDVNRWPFGNADFVVEMNGRHYARSKLAALLYSLLYGVPRSLISIMDFTMTRPQCVSRLVVLPRKPIPRDQLNIEGCSVTFEPQWHAVAITPGGTCKAEGLVRLLSRKYGEADLDHVIAFGDGRNDCMLLRRSRVGVAVQGSHEEAVAAADVHLDGPIGTSLISMFGSCIPMD